MPQMPQILFVCFVYNPLEYTEIEKTDRNSMIQDFEGYSNKTINSNQYVLPNLRLS